MIKLNTEMNHLDVIMEHIIVSLVHLHSFLRFVPVSAITMPATGSATFLLPANKNISLKHIKKIK